MTKRRPTDMGRLLRGHRLAAGLTHEQLAINSEVSMRTISDMERGVDRRPHRSTVDLLVKGLKLTGAAREEFERAAYPPAPPPQPLEEPTPSRLPRMAGTLFGRDAEQAALAALVRREALVTLVGAGGCGKTSLAIAVGRSLADDFPGRLWFVPLAATTSATEVASAILLVCGARPPEDVVPEEALRT